MMWFEFSKKFPEMMEEKGWALYNYESRLFSLKYMEETISRGKVRLLEIKKRYLVLPYAESDLLTDILSLIKKTAEPPCYRQPQTSLIYPIDSLRVVTPGIMQILIDFRLFSLFNPDWKGSLPLVTLPFFMLKEKEIKERFNSWAPKFPLK
ncbi:MAG TPA: hypothetical protein ENG63_00065 [Candidatus Desulfofervidus auxilii]|uniref:Uncharacterized protein n=1 Tax=Desulfofervidus auxilii TaxID=1621989 RepID=A0A7C0U1C2_DESA2|nr:hypothetical protein [Candidatus Desulfofervidus auxilii]